VRRQRRRQRGEGCARTAFNQRRAVVVRQKIAGNRISVALKLQIQWKNASSHENPFLFVVASEKYQRQAKKY